MEPQGDLPHGSDPRTSTKDIRYYYPKQELLEEQHRTQGARSLKLFVLAGIPRRAVRQWLGQ